MNVFDLEIPVEDECVARHMGYWLVENDWLARCMKAIENGTIKPMAIEMQARAAEKQPFQMFGDLAMVEIRGAMMKGRSKFRGNTSTVDTRRAVRQAANDPEVKGILLRIDSPGGMVAGTQELADDVARANKAKPVYSFVEDLGASAAYWVASQSERIIANKSAIIGSIGVITTLEDTSELAKRVGVKVHVVTTAPHKAVGTPGTEITDDQISIIKQRLDDINSVFLSAIKAGRGMSDEQLQIVSDGRAVIASKARSLGLIDNVGSLDSALNALGKASRDRARQGRMRSFLENAENIS